jgi:chemotaxis protein MotB
MALRKKAPPAGAPEWVLTYGDMMSLLLCFFILLAAFADYEKGGPSERTLIAIASIQEALGLKVTGRAAQTAVQFNSMVEQVKAAVRDLQDKPRGNADEAGFRGREFRLRRMRDGMEIAVGGPVLFDPFSSELTPEGREALAQIGTAIKGHRNMIDIRGHAGEGFGKPDWTYEDAMRLSSARAARVARELVATGLDPRTLRLVAVGDNEPLCKDDAGRAIREDSRRVEIIVRESLLDDFR